MNTTYVHTTQPMAATTYVPLGPVSQALACPHCHANISTRVETKATMKTHVVAFLLCFLGCWCGCCLIPYMTDSCMGSEHYCPACGNFLGSHER